MDSLTTEVTRDWCEVVEAATDDELRTSAFFRLAWSIGVPGGVVATERSIRCLLRIGRANGHESDEDYKELAGDLN